MTVAIPAPAAPQCRPATNATSNPALSTDASARKRMGVRESPTLRMAAA